MENKCPVCGKDITTSPSVRLGDETLCLRCAYMEGDEALRQRLAQAEIAKQCDAVKELLLAKNREYGNSALEPVGCFSGDTAEQQIRVRIDDKLKRIKTIRGIAEVRVHEDTEQDLIGYLVLLRVARELV